MMKKEEIALYAVITTEEMLVNVWDCFQEQWTNSFHMDEIC